MALTPRQEKFCVEYVKTGNKSEAYRLAYSSENMKPETVNNNAYKLFSNNDILTRIEELRNKALKRSELTIDQIVNRLKEIAFENESDRVSAADKLMKYLGGYEKDNDQKVPKTKDYSKLTDEEIITLAKLEQKAG